MKGKKFLERGIFFPNIFIIFLFYGLAFTQPTSCTFWSHSNSRYMGQLITDSDQIKAYDPRDGLCGEATGVPGYPGSYTISVYGVYENSEYYPDGAYENDTISFTINGMLADVVGGSNIWNDKGSVICDLEVPEQSPNAVHEEPYSGLKRSDIFLFQNYPNPFNASTTITYTVSVKSEVTLQIFDASGRIVRSLLVKKLYRPGVYRIVWDGQNDQGECVSSGIYMSQLQAGRLKRTGKMVLIY